jgi:hypothetical protein
MGPNPWFGVIKNTFNECTLSSPGDFHMGRWWFHSLGKLLPRNLSRRLRYAAGMVLRSAVLRCEGEVLCCAPYPLLLTLIIPVDACDLDLLCGDVLLHKLLALQPVPKRCFACVPVPPNDNLH